VLGVCSGLIAHARCRCFGARVGVWGFEYVEYFYQKPSVMLLSISGMFEERSLDFMALDHERRDCKSDPTNHTTRRHPLHNLQPHAHAPLLHPLLHHTTLLPPNMVCRRSRRPRNLHRLSTHRIRKMQSASEHCKHQFMDDRKGNMEKGGDKGIVYWRGDNECEGCGGIWVLVSWFLKRHNC
jgi:hypothetical protein